MAGAKIAQKEPYAVEVTEGKYYSWCSCGLSQTQPFCDNSHSETDFVPVIWKADATKTAYFCGCKQTKKGPFCDGAHSSI